MCKAQDEQDDDWTLIDFFALHHFLQLANIIEQQHLCRIPIDQILQQIGVKSLFGHPKASHIQFPADHNMECVAQDELLGVFMKGLDAMAN